MPTSMPARSRGEQLDRGGGRDDDDRGALVLGDPQRAGRQRAAVEDHRGCAGARRGDGGRLRVGPDGRDDGAARDEAEALRVEEVRARATGEPAGRARRRRPRSVSACVGATEPSSGTRWSKITSSPRRSTTRTRGSDARESVAPTASAPAPPAGPAIEPNDGPAPPSFPAGATTSVFRSSAPCTARASGPSVNAAYGSATPMSATRTASCASPSPFGSTARSSPAISWSLRA